MFDHYTHMVGTNHRSPRVVETRHPRAPCVENQANLHVAPLDHTLCVWRQQCQQNSTQHNVGTGVTRMWWAWGPHKNEDPNTTHGMGLPIHDPKHPPARPLMWGVETSGGKRNNENM